MDTLYVGNIPLNYKYAVFHEDYIDLFSTPTPSSSSDFYRLFYFGKTLLYSHETINSYIGSTVSINTTDYWLYRQDLADITFVSLVLIAMIVLVFNLVTSSFKKGGLFGDLL